MDRLIELEDPKISLVTGTALALLAVSSIHSLRRSKRPNRPDRVLETADSTLPVVGNLVDAITRNDDFHDWFMEQTVRFNGRMWRVVIPGQGEMIVATTPEAVEEVLSTQFDTFVKGAYQIGLLDGLHGRGILTSDGERWYHQCKTTVKFFSANVLDQFMRQSIRKNMQRVHTVMDNAIQTKQPVDLNALFHDFTIDTFVEMGLGVDLKSIGATTRHAFNEALDDAARIVSQRFRRPEWAWKLERWMNVGEEAVLKRHMDTVHEWMRGVIQESVDGLIQKKQSGVDTSNQVGKSIVELFLEHADEEKDGLSHNDLIDFVVTLVVGARDTTADTLTWLFYALGKHPEVEKKLRDEMKRELTSGRSTYLTTEQLKPLVYLEAVIKETLRLYPAAPFTFREATEDTVICNDVFVRKGQQVVIPVYSIAHSPAVWGPDAAVFRPERWIGAETGKIKPDSSFKFVSFSAGARICAGIKLAMLELRIVTANLLHRYCFSVDSNKDGSYTMAVTLPMKYPLLVTPIAL